MHLRLFTIALLAVFVTLSMPALAAPWTFNVLHTFSAVSLDGLEPSGPLIADSAGDLYGVTSGSDIPVPGGDFTCSIPNPGDIGCGVVYELTPPVGTQPWSERILHVFAGGANDAEVPFGKLAADARGNLYGHATGGRCNDGCAFEISSAGVESIIFRWHCCRGGVLPSDFTVDASGALYGSAGQGGLHGAGSIFKLTPPATPGAGWTRTILYDFTNGADGSGPGALVMDAKGNLYGTTQQGGSSTACYNVTGCGAVFELAPPAAGRTGWTERTLHTFTGLLDGGVPNDHLILNPNGTLYGTTVEGGLYPQNFSGVAFDVVPQTNAGPWTFNVIHSFGTGNDGNTPAGSLTAAPNFGALYGVTAAGGTSDRGTIFRLVPQGRGGWSESVLYSFGFNGPDIRFNHALLWYGRGTLAGVAGSTVFDLSE